MRILGIESSCDETAVSLVEGKGERVTELASLVASSAALHAKTGGVVPEVAAREHVNAVSVLLAELFRGKKPKVDAIAVTAGPGLFSSLLVGVETAKALSYAWNVPLVRTNHIEGHVYSSVLGAPKPIVFPAIALIVSGGHTEIILMKKHGSYQLIGRTKDDASGEAFDKTAQMLGLGYPGGPAISKAALSGNPEAYKLPRPMMKEKNFDFSFAGLKTAVLYSLKKQQFLPEADQPLAGAISNPKVVHDMSASVQAAIVEVLVHKTILAAEKYKAKTVLVGGGVAANDALRLELTRRFKDILPKVTVRLPEKKYTTDNAVMIAAAGYYRAKAKKFTSWQKIKADPNWELV